MVAQFTGHAASVAETPDGVALVRWPEDHERVERLRADGRPRLLLLGESSPPPLSLDLDEDWIRLPASEADLHARSVALAARAAGVERAPRISGGRLVHRGEWIALSPIEESLTRALVAGFGELVPLGDLTRALDDHVLTPNAVRVHVMRLRKRILELGLVVRTLHGRGYLLELA